MSTDKVMAAITKKQSALNKRIVNFETWDTISPVYREHYIPAGSIKSGVSAPIEALRAVGASGGVLIDVQQFSQIQQNDVYFEFHPPKELQTTTPVQFHLMWLPGAAWTVGNYLWKLEYLLMDEDAAYNTGTPQTIEMDVTPANALNMIETEFTTTIPITDREQILMCHFYRDVAGDNADSTGDVNFFEIKYRIDRLGSAS